MSKNKYFKGCVLLAIAAFVILCVLGALFSSNETETVPTTVVGEQVEEVSIPIPPTATKLPDPTATEKPAPTATSVPPTRDTAKETAEALAAYKEDIQNLSAKLALSLYRFSDLNMEAGNDISVMFDPTWRAEAVAEALNFQDLSHQLAEYENYPPEYAEAHKWFKKLGPEADDLVDNYLNGLETFDKDSLSACVENINNITTYINKALEVLPDQ